MKFTFNWLKDHLETPASLEEIVERLSMLGLEVEDVTDRGKQLVPFTVAHVIEAAPHPDADRLKVCRVATGEGEAQVVCGAPNAHTGMYGVFAAPGSYIPGTDLDLKPGVIRGVESRGMLVSERELGISDEHEGIIELNPEDFGGELKVGQAFAPLAGLDDAVIEIAITPNRGDCLGVRGIARDLAAAGLGSLKPLKADPVPGSFESPRTWKRDLPADDQGACPYVAGRSFRGVKNGPAPKWLQDRLRAIGLRPISALVDITNYVTFDLGRPLHVFDAGKLTGDPTMRLARQGESLEALDENSYALDSETLVIADDNGPQAIGGIMGGEATGCQEDTTEVFLEVALFDPIRIAFTGRRLGIHSDARYRFERGVDPESARWGVEVATRMILDLCGGEASEAVAAGTLPEARPVADLRASRVASLGGVEIPAAEQQNLLEKLGFEVELKGETLSCTVPSWRPDIEGEACLVEEVLRLHGYEALPLTPPQRDESLPRDVLTVKQKRFSAVRQAMAWRGLEEAVTFSFIAERQARLFGWEAESLRVDNPISSDLDVMRPSILPTLLDAASRNAARAYPDGAFFEIGPQYAGTAPEDQTDLAATLRSGRAVTRHWLAESRAVDVFDAKADALKALEAAGAPVDSLQVTADAPAWYHPGRSGQLCLGPKVLASFGELHPRVLKAFDLKGTAVACEVYVESIPEPKVKASKARPALELSAYQPVERDFAFLMDADVPSEKAIRAAKGADKKLVTGVEVFDVYSGKGVPEGQKSLALCVTLQPRDKTLTDEDLEAISAKIIAQVEKATGGSLRG